MRVVLFTGLFLFIVFFANAQFINGDFQTSSNTGLCDAGAGWVLTTGSVPPQYVSAGNNWVDMTPCGSFGNGCSIEQTINTLPGNAYYITIDLGTCFGWQIWDAGVDIYINGNPLNVGTNRLFNDSFSNTVGGMLWKTMSSSVFTATSNLTTVKITSDGANPQNPAYNQPAPGPPVIGIDNIVLVNRSGTATAIHEETEVKTLKLYPNPADAFFKIIPDDENQAYESVEITDLTGKTVILKSQADAQSLIDIAGLKPGIYFVKAQRSKRILLTKLIKT